MLDPAQALLRIDTDQPPVGLTALQRALWFDAKGDWAEAHELVATETGPDAAWVHAYLHRKEGDLGNARYWYRLAGKDPCAGSLQDEWLDLARTLTATARDGAPT